MGLLRPLPAPEEAPGRASLSPSSALQRVSWLGWSRRGSAASSSRMQVLGCNCPLCSALWLSPGSLASHPCAQSPSLAPAPAAAGVLPAPGTFSLHPPKKPPFSTPVASRPLALWPPLAQRYPGIPLPKQPFFALLCFALQCFALQCVAFSPREFPSVARPGPVALAPAQTRLWPAGPLRAGWVEPGAPGWDWGWKRVAPGESVLMTPKLSLLAILVPPLVGKGTWGHRGDGKRRPSPGGCAGLAGARSAGVGSAWICGRTGRRSGQGRTG